MTSPEAEAAKRTKKFQEAMAVKLHPDFLDGRKIDHLQSDQVGGRGHVNFYYLDQ